MQENDTSRRRKFYDQMSEAYDLGSFEEFDSKMNNAESREKLWQFIDNDGRYDIGDFEYFDKAMQPVVAKEPTPAAQPAAQQTTQPQQPTIQPQANAGHPQPTDAAGNPITNNGQPYSQEVLDAFYSPDNTGSNFRDLSQIAADMQQAAATTQPTEQTAPVPNAGVEVPYRPEPYIEQPFKEKNEEMQRMAEDPNLNRYWGQTQEESDKSFAGQFDKPFGERMEAWQEADEAEKARQMNRSGYDEQNFEKFYQDHVAPVFTEERQKGEQQSHEAVKDIPRYDVPGAQSGFARMFESSMAEAKYTDPEKIAGSTLRRVQDDDSFGDYVLGRMGVTDNGGDNGDSPDLSDREKEMMKLLFGKETEEVAQQITNRIYEQYKQENTPKSVLDYIAGKAFHENMAASLYDAMVKRASGSSGIREQLRAMASEEFGKDQSWWTRMAGGAAPFAVDMLTGAFGVPNMVGQAVVKGGTKMAAKQVVKEMEKRAAARGLENAALKEATSGAAGVAERYLATQAPILNLALRAAGSAANFATYDVQGEMIRQLSEGEFKPVDLMGAAVRGAVLGGAMGATGGAIGHAARNASRLGKVAAGAGGLGAETTIFGVSNGLAKAQAEGVDIEDVDWADTMGEAFGQVVGMKTVGSVMHPKEFLNRYRKSKDYDLQLNQRDINDLKAAGYDFDGIFKGLGKFGETAPMEATSISKAKEYTVGPEGTASKKNTTSEEAWVDADTYKNVLSDPRVSSATKRKLVYVATGKVLMPEPVFGVTMNVDEDGKATVTTTNAYGDVIETKDYDSEEKARKDYDTLQGVSRINTVDGLEGIAEQAGFTDLVDAAKGRTMEETGEDVDKALSGEMEDKEQADNVIDNYVKNLQEAYMERFNEKLKKIGEAPQAAGDGEAPTPPNATAGGGASGGTETGGGTPPQRTERRDAAYNRGTSVVQNEADLSTIGQDSRLAEARLMQQLPDSDQRLSTLRNVIMQGVTQGNDEEVDNLINDAINRKALTTQQIEAIEQWRDAVATQWGIEDAVAAETEQYQQQRRTELEAISDPQGYIIPLQLKDGTTVYYKSGDLDNHYGGVFAIDETGQTRQVTVREIADVLPAQSMESILEQDVNIYADNMTNYYNALKDGTQLMNGQQVDMKVSGQPLKATFAGTAPDGRAVFQLEDGSMMPMTPEDAGAAMDAAEDARIQMQLAQEAESARLAEQQQRFTDKIAGFTEGQPDLSSPNTDPKTAAEYVRSQIEATSQEPKEVERKRKQYVSDIQNTKEQLTQRHEEVQKELDRLNQWMAGNEDIADPQEVEQTRQRIAQLTDAIGNIVARQQQWGEIRRELMTQEELNQLEQQRRKDIFKARTGYQPQLPQRNLSTNEDRVTTENGQPNFGLTSVGNANNYLLRNFPESTDAESFINEQRLMLRNRQRDEIQPEINRRNDLLNAYTSGHQELSPDEVAQLVHEVADLEAMQSALSDEAVRLREIAEGIPALYERNGREQQLTPAEQRGKQLDKATSREDKVRIAQNIYKDYPEAIDIISDQEPRDIAEYIASNLGLGSINWEGIDRGSRHIRGLQEELGRGWERGIGKGYSTNAFNMYLAPTGEGKGVEEIVHALYEAQPDLGDGKRYSTEDIRNGLIDLLTTAQRPSDISHRVIDNRIAEAESIVERQEALEREMEEQAKLEEMEQWAEAYHLTPEEREDFEEFMRMPPTEPEQEMINQIIAEYEEQNTTGKGLDSQHSGGEAGGDRQGSQSEVHGQGATGETGGDQEQQRVEGAEAGAGMPSVPDTDVAGGASGERQFLGDLNRLIDNYESGANGYMSENDLIEEVRSLSETLPAGDIKKRLDNAFEDYDEMQDAYYHENGQRDDDGTDVMMDTIRDVAATKLPEANDKTDNFFPARLAEAKAETDVNPTEAQKKAGNYKMGHVSFGGYDYSIENPKGSIRSGVDASGKPWSIEMKDTYGYILRKIGVDGDHLDMFINDDADLDNWDGRVFIVDQKNPDGSFDEHKVMYGYPNWSKARKAYERNYEPGWWDSHVMQMMGVRKADFDKWLADSDHKTKPFADYWRTKNADTVSDPAEQLMADIKDREEAAAKATIKPTWDEKQLARYDDDGIVQLRKKAQKDLSTSRFLLKSIDAAKNSEKEATLLKNIAQAETDISTLDAEIQKRNEQKRKLIEDMEAGGAMVDHLKNMGIDVTDNVSEMRKARKQAEKDNSQEGKMRKMATADGNVYGFAYRGKLYLDPRKIDANLPLHEYGHLWCEAFRRLNPEGWKEIVGVMKQDADTWNFVKSMYPDLKSEDDIAEEVIAKSSGENGEQRIREEFERMSQRDPSYKGKWANIWKNISKAIQDFWKKAGDFLKIKYESAQQVYDQVLKDFANGVNPRKKVEQYLKQRNDEYMQAAESGDVKRAAEIFNEALAENIGNGITPFMAVDGYRGKLQTLARRVKGGSKKAIREAAELMAPMIPENAVLVPVPSHNGKATDMLQLANTISELTGAEVADVLQSKPRRSQYEEKKATGKAVPSAEMGIALNGELPKDKTPIIIDNVVASGNTAEACVRAIGKGIVATLADATDKWRHAATLKNAAPILRDKDGNVIPLDKRFDIDSGKYLGMRPNAAENLKTQKVVDAAIEPFEPEPMTPIEKKTRQRATDAVIKVVGDTGVSIKQVSQEEADQMMQLMISSNNEEVTPHVVSGKDKDGKDETYEFMFDDGAKPNPVLYSNAMKAVEGIKQDKATPDQWLKMIEKQGGLKAGEDKWIGLSDWLKQQQADGKKTLTKQEVEDYIREHQIEIEEAKYKEYFNVDENPQMIEFRKEFDKLVEKYKQEKAAVEKDMETFEPEMYKKYGYGWANKLEGSDLERYNDIYGRYERLETNAPQELAYQDMVENHGEDFGMAFEVNYGNGKLEPTMDMYGDELSDAAKYFLQFDEQPINSARLGYTTEGLDNKREIALTVPTVEPYNESDQVHFGDAGGGTAVAWVRFGDTTVPVKEQVYKYADEFEEPWNNGRGSIVYWPKGMKNGKDYIVYGKTRSGDYVYGVFINEAGIGTWKTFDEAQENMNAYYQNHPTTQTTGRQKVLVIDEIQSKRHQDARERGYQSQHSQRIEEIQNKINEKEKEKREFLDLLRNKYRSNNLLHVITKDEKLKFEYLSLELDNLISDLNTEKTVQFVPEAPFEKNWHELAMKRMLRYAAENGYDKIAWTTGNQQAERYNIGGKVDWIQKGNEYGEEPERIYLKIGNATPDVEIDENGMIIDASSQLQESVGKSLGDLVGKELAVKILNAKVGKEGRLEGEDLRVGGEGMKGFYDDILPRFMDKYGKKWGVKTGEIDLPDIGDQTYRMSADGKMKKGLTMHSIDVTPEMKESVMEGQPMFQKGQQGKIYGWTDGTGIFLTPLGMNPNSPMHEYTHIWDKYIQKNDPKLWKEMVDTFKKTAIWQEISQNENYRSIWNDDDRMASEVHSRLTGARSQEEFEKAAADPNNKDTESIIRQVRDVLRRFWEKIASLFGYGKDRLEEFVLMPLRDVLNGLDPRTGKYNGDPMAMMGWHGSASKFERFDHSKIGSGEGQAVSGYGTYITTSEGTARYYAKVASDKQRNVIQKMGYTVGGEVVADPALARAYDYLKKADGNAEEAIKACEHTIEVLNRHKEKDPFAAMKALRGNGKSIAEEALDYLRKEQEKPGTIEFQEEIVEQPNKQLYEVDIPDDNGSNYLDLDKKLTKKQKADIKEKFLEALDSSDEADYWKKNRDVIEYDWKYVDSPEGTGDAARGVMEQFLDSQKVSQIFSNMGYVGSKTKGSDGTTYIIYNDGDVKIVNRVEFQIENPKAGETGVRSLMEGNLFSDADFLPEEKQTKGKRTLNDNELLKAISKSDGERRRRMEDIYDSRHMSDLEEQEDAYADMLLDNNTTLEQAMDMYDNVFKEFVQGGYASPDRTKYLAQIDALENYISELQLQEEERMMEEQELAEKTQKFEQEKEEIHQSGYDLTMLRLRPLEEGETCHVERRYQEDGYFSFTGSERISSIEDVAYIFKQLENSAVENTFVVLEKDGIPTIIHLGMGEYTESGARLRPALAAYYELQPDKVYFVHNHPSGRLVCSKADMDVMTYMRKIFGKKLQDGIIIDTTSGKFGLFSDKRKENVEVNMPDSPENSVPMKVYSFSKQVFDADWNPDTAFDAGTAVRVAKFVSSHRLGEHKKMSLIVMNQAYKVTGNVFLPYTKLEQAVTEEGADLIARYMNQMGGTIVTVFGSYDFDPKQNHLLGELNRMLQKRDVYLVDVVHIGEDASRYHSGREAGYVSEPGLNKTNAGEAEVVDMPVKQIEDMYSEGLKPAEAINMQDRVQLMSPNELIKQYRRLNSEMLDENGLNIDEQEDAFRQNWADEHGWPPTQGSGFGKAMADHTAAQAEKYTFNKMALRWDILDRIKELGLEDYIDKDINELPDVNTAEIVRMYRRSTPQIEKLNKRFNDDLEKLKKGELPNGHVFEMGMPSMPLLSTGIPNAPIRLHLKVLNSKMNDPAHPFTVNEVKDLVKRVQQPLAIFEYGDKEKSQNLMVGIYQARDDGRQFLVGLALEPEVKGKKLEYNSVRNVFPKNFHDWVHWINQGKLLRVDGKDEIEAIIDALRINPVDYISNDDLDSAAKIVKDFENPKLSEEKLRNIYGKWVTAGDETADMLGGVKVVYESEAPEEGTLGWYDPNDNTVHVVLPNHADVGEVKRTVCHEKLGHEGLVALLGDQAEVNKFGQFIFKSASKDLRQRIVQKADDEGYDWNDPQRFSKAAQEVLADIAADGPRTADEFSLWRKVKHYLIRLLNKLGLRIRGLLNDHDLRYYVLKTGEALKRWSQMSPEEQRAAARQETDYDLMRSRRGRPRKRNNESMAQYLQRLRDWERWKIAEEEAAANNDPMPEAEKINEKWHEKYNADLAEWKRQNNIADDTQGVGQFPRRESGESPQEYAARVADYETQVDAWNGAPNLFEYLRLANDEYRQAYAAWKERYGIREAESVDMGLYEGDPDAMPHIVDPEDLEADMRAEAELAEAVGIDMSSEGARRHAKLSIVERRKNLESANAEDAIWLHNLVKEINEEAKRQGVKPEELREAMADIIEGTYFEDVIKDEDGNVIAIEDISDQLPIKKTPGLEAILSEIKDWYDYFFHEIEDAGLRNDAGYIEQGYVNHVWSKEKSNPDAWNKYVENFQRTKSPNMRERMFNTYREGRDVGLVPKFSDIADILAYYSSSNNQAIANKKFLDDLSFIVVEEKNSDGEVVTVLPLINSHKPSITVSDFYKMYQVPGVGEVYVLKEVQRQFANIFGTMRTQDIPEWLSKVGKVYDVTSSTAKKIELSFSAFHMGALTEVAMAQMRPDRALRALGQYIIFDCAKAGTVPAYAHPEDFKLAAGHLVQLGATQDYSAADVNNVTEKIREIVRQLAKKENLAKKGAGYAATPIAAALDYINKGMDKVLWNYLHDGLKIACFKMFAEQIERRVEKDGLSPEQREQLLDEAGQYVNDTFGGQYWELLNVSPALIKWLRRGFLSPDWLISTQRHFLANFGFGSVYSESGFLNYLRYNADNIKRAFGADIPRDENRRFRSKNAKQCYLLGVCGFFYIMMNALNAMFRAQDEAKDKEEADEIRKTNPDYKSPYELAYPDGMKWYDYTMYGNTIGQQTHLFLGRYDDGSEWYARWGKQFREFPELFMGRHGFEFPTPLMERMSGKANPIGRYLMYDLPLTVGMYGYKQPRETQEIAEKYGNTIALLAMTAKKFVPYSVPTQQDKEFKMFDLVMPSQKGFTRWKAVDFFKTYIQGGDMDGVMRTYNAAVMNGIDAEDCLKAAIATVKATQRKELSDGIVDLQSAMDRYDAETNVAEKKRLRQKIFGYLAEQNYKAFTRDEAKEQVENFLNGDQPVQADNDINKYVKLATSADVRDEYRIEMIRKQAKKYVDEVKTAEGDRQKRLEDTYGNWLDIYDIIKDANREIGKLKKDLGKGNDDAAIMEEIRNIRKEAQKEVDKIQAP